MALSQKDKNLHLELLLFFNDIYTDIKVKRLSPIK